MNFELRPRLHPDGEANPESACQVNLKKCDNTFFGLVVVWALIFMIVYTTSNAQPYSNLVFEGAGIRGYAYVGVIQELEANGLMNDVQKVGGTSAGAIAALTVALGYNSDEIAAIMNETKPQKFNDGQFFFIGGMIRMNRDYGWYRGKAFTRWIEQIIKNKTGNGDVTFDGLRKKGFRELYVTGTSLNRQELIIFSHENYPHMKVKDAIRISVSIPYYFVAVPIDTLGNVLTGRQEEADHVMVDGGFTGNFPIFMFDSVSTGESKQRFANVRTVGFRIDNPDQIKSDTTTRSLAHMDIRGFKNYTQAFYNYIIENLNRTNLTRADWQRTVSISSGDIGPKIRKLRDEEKSRLITNGRDATRAFLARGVVQK